LIYFILWDGSDSDSDSDDMVPCASADDCEADEKCLTVGALAMMFCAPSNFCLYKWIFFEKRIQNFV